MSDQWKSYKNLGQNVYFHFEVNHSKNFVDPQSHAHSQLIESLWNQTKNGKEKIIIITINILMIMCKNGVIGIIIKIPLNLFGQHFIKMKKKILILLIFFKLVFTDANNYNSHIILPKFSRLIFNSINK